MSLRVLHLIDSGGLYGAEKMLLTLVKEQIKQGLQPMILSAGEPGIGDKAIELEAKRLGLPVTPWRMKPGLNIRGIKELVNWARCEGYELFHSHGYKFNILLGMTPKNELKAPTVATLHGYVKARPLTKMWIYEVIDRRVLRRMDAVVLVNEKMRELAPIQRLKREKVFLIPNGVALEDPPKPACWQERPDISGFISRHSFSIVAIGRLSPEKSFETAVKALKLMRASTENIGLCIMGSGALQQQLADLAEKLGLAEHVYFAGYVEGASRWIQKFHCLVMPSLTEGLPVTLLEAMKAHVPVVASKVGGIPGAVVHKESALLITPGIEHELAASVDKIRKSKNLARTLCSNAFETLQERFSSNAMSEKYLEVYRDIIALDRRRESNE